MKIASGIGSILFDKMILFNGTSTTFKQIKIRPRQDNCPVCGAHPTITAPIDYEAWCGKKVTYTKDDKATFNTITPEEMHNGIKNGIITPENTVFVDIRPKNHLEVAQIKLISNTFKIISMPLSEMKKCIMALKMEL